jgi:hypothetical protein
LKFKILYNLLEMNTKRVSIQHLNQMKPQNFIKLMDYFKKDLKGIISNTTIDVKEKVDGSVWSWGLDDNNNFFTATAHMGKFYNPGDFTNYVSKKYPDMKMDMIQGFDQAFSDLKNNKKLQKTLLKYNNGGMKILSELLYNPFGKVENGKIRFVGIEYDQKKLGKDGSIVIYNITNSVGEKYPNKKEITKDIIKCSNDDWKFFDDSIKMNEVDINIDITNLEQLLKNYKEVDKLLVSRKKADRETKYLLKGLIGKIQDEVSQKILKAVQGGKLGDQFEGIVMNLNNGMDMLKVVTPDFAKGKKKFDAENKK